MKAPAASEQEQQSLIAVSPILEAFGNASTVNNSNASRFGQCTKVLYDFSMLSSTISLSGSYVETFLLEKSRVVFQRPGERNFHIPYFLYHGVAKEYHKELGIRNPKELHYTNQGGCSDVIDINDAGRYTELMESLKTLHIDENTTNNLWRITAGIFSLGNVGFCDKGDVDGFAAIDPDSIENLETIASLWGCRSRSFDETTHVIDESTLSDRLHWSSR